METPNNVGLVNSFMSAGSNEATLANRRDPFRCNTVKKIYWVYRILDLLCIQ